MSEVSNTPKRLCSIDGCEKPAKARSWCAMHYQRWWVHGDPLVNLNPPHETQHGTVNEYNNFGCRCDACKAAMSEYQRTIAATPCPSCGAPIYGRWRPEQVCRECATARATTPLDELHGSETGYSRGCRCSLCRKAQADARRRRRHADPERQREYDRERYRRRRTPLQRATSRLAEPKR